MCGIAGLWDDSLQEARQTNMAAMLERVAWRGPDARDQWHARDGGPTLGHLRLSILDLSELGAQPMSSASGRYVMTYNGEVYNAADMAKELGRAGYTFRGHSDTEVILAAIEHWGLSHAVGRFVGMFAFALWDTRERCLHLVRDRLGIKPLYVAQQGGRLAFSSDLASIASVPWFERRLDAAAVTSFFRYACVPGDQAIFQDTRKVTPGTIETFGLAGRPPHVEPYWSAHDVAVAGLATPLDVDAKTAADLVQDSLYRSVVDRQVSNVQLGVLLSGGIDSSVVAAMMVRSGARTRTYSIGFDDDAYNEASDAQEVARHLGTEHTELIVRPAEAMDVIPTLSEIYSEPFADSSQIPTFLVSQLARRDVTVVLSGDGGDEVFGGYNRHLWGPRVWRLLRAAPAALRGSIARRLAARSPKEWDTTFATLSRSFRALTFRTPGDKVHKLAGLLPADDVDELYARLTSIWQDPRTVLENPQGSGLASHAAVGGAVSEEFMLRDLGGYLQDDILTKVDRASMAVSLEARVPLLDHRLVELAWRIPLRHKVHEGVGKVVLRDVLSRGVPRSMFERPKMGFGIPVGDWLRGPMRPWAEELLDAGQLRSAGVLDADVVQDLWQRHLSGQAAVQHQLWTVLMFQAWSRRWLAS